MEIVGEAKAVFEELTSVGLGVTGGFIGGAFIGRQIQNFTGCTDAKITGPTDYSNIGLAWAANNLPKIGLWYLLRKYDAATELTKDISKALIGSVAWDSLVRLLSGGVNNGVTVAGYQLLPAGSVVETGVNTGIAYNQAQIQQMAQEINVLKAELKKAMTLAAQPPYGAPPLYNPQAAGPIVTPYIEGAPLPAPASRRAHQYGFMPGQTGLVSGAPVPVAAEAAQPVPTIAQKRQEGYGFMVEQKAGLSKAAAMCGMQ